MSEDPEPLPSVVPLPGVSYEWKSVSPYSAARPRSIEKLEKDGWIAVPRSRHPEIDSDSDENIVVGSVLLMERPQGLTDEAQAEDTAIASDAIFRRRYLGGEAGSISVVKEEARKLISGLGELGWPVPDDPIQIGWTTLAIVWHPPRARKPEEGEQSYVKIEVSALDDDKKVEPLIDTRGSFRLMKEGAKYVMIEGQFHGVCAGRSTADSIEIINRFRWVLGL